MKTFGELKNFTLLNDNCYIYTENLKFQVYESSPTQFNISTIDDQAPVIKFEERCKNIFTVAVVDKCDQSYTIAYHKSFEFKLTDNISDLLNVFPNGKYINIIVEDLISI